MRAARMAKNIMLRASSDLESQQVNLRDEENVIGQKKKRESTAEGNRAPVCEYKFLGEGRKCNNTLYFNF